MAANGKAYTPIVDKEDAHAPEASPVLTALQRQYNFLGARLSRTRLLQSAAAALILGLFAAVLVLALQEGHRHDARNVMESLHASEPVPGPVVEQVRSRLAAVQAARSTSGRCPERDRVLAGGRPDAVAMFAAAEAICAHWMESSDTKTCSQATAVTQLWHAV